MLCGCAILVSLVDALNNSWILDYLYDFIIHYYANSVLKSFTTKIQNLVFH